MSYELPCGCIFASLDACAFALLGTFDIALLVACGITSLAANNRGKGKEPLELLFLGLLP